MSRYVWIPWTQPVLTSDTDYGTLSVSSINISASSAWKASDGLHEGTATSWESANNGIPAWWLWELPVTLKISSILLYNKYSGSTKVTDEVAAYADGAMTQQIGETQHFAASAFSTVTITPEAPVETDKLLIRCVSAHQSVGNQYVGLGEVVITAEERQLQYEVSFRDWDGTVLKTDWVQSGGAATAPANPSRVGYTFIGWDVPINNITADTVVTAQYEALTYTVTFKDWDGTVLKTESVAYGQPATAPSNPTRDGYRFTGWDKPFSSIIADTVVTATYVLIVNYTVTFEDWDETVLKAEIVEQGYDATPPADPVREDYAFTGWSPPYTNVQADLLTTAQYELIVIYHTVTFLDYDGSVLKTEQVEEGDAALPPLPPLREGFVFDHWDTDFSNVMTDLTVTAVYRAALDHTVIKIYNSSYALVQTVEKVLSANYSESLDGELTFEFSTLAERVSGIEVNYVAEYEGCYFNIVRVAKSISSGIMVVAVTCEHISYVLNEDRYKIDLFDFTGPPATGLAQLLAGTQFSAGTVDYTSPVTMQINTSVTRRGALMQYIAILGGEIEYSGHAINIRRHRGSTAVKQLMESKNVTDVSVTHDSRSDTASYSVSFHRIANYEVGDEVHIVFTPLGVDTNTRIISMEYNPFYRYSIRVEVGSYVPTINDNLYQIEKTATEQDEGMSEIWNAFDDFESDYSDFQTDYNDFLNTFKEVQNLSVGLTQFTVSFTDCTTSTYDYTVDGAGRITGISRVV